MYDFDSNIYNQFFVGNEPLMYWWLTSVFFVSRDIHDVFASCVQVARVYTTGGRLNIKIPSYQYRKSHFGDKTILRPSYLHNGISYTGKMTSLYWIRARMLCGYHVEGTPWGRVTQTSPSTLDSAVFWSKLLESFFVISLIGPLSANRREVIIKIQIS